MKKQINWEKGLFRIYIIPTLCGLVCFFLAAYNFTIYKKNHSKFISYVEAHPLPPEPKEREKIGLFNFNDYDWNSKEEVKYEQKCREVQELHHSHYSWLPSIIAKQNAVFYMPLFFGLSVLPWLIHYFIKVLILPVFKWLAKGFRS